MRLPNGFGTIYKLPGKRRRPWIARVTVGYDDNGKQLYEVVGYYEKRELALFFFDYLQRVAIDLDGTTIPGAGQASLAAEVNTVLHLTW